MKQIFLIVGLIIVGPACFLLMTQVLRSKQAKENVPPPIVVIQVGKSGFSPKKMAVKPGTIVRWKNVSGAPQTVNSDNYPTNQIHKAFVGSQNISMQSLDQNRELGIIVSDQGVLRTLQQTFQQDWSDSQAV